MTKYADLINKLRQRKIVDAKAGITRGATEEELAAASAIESLEFQLSCRIEAARAEAKEVVTPEVTP